MQINRSEVVEKINNLADKIKKSAKLEGSDLEVAGAFYKLFMETIGIEFDYNSDETPFRVAKMYLKELASSLKNPPPILTTFPNTLTNEGIRKCDEYVIVRDIPFFSICAHHHVTFFGKAHIAYHPDEHLLGISKFARVVDYFSKKPHIQEELTSEIACFLWDALKPKGLAIKMEAEHLCMTSRGIKAIGSKTVTQKYKGIIDKVEVESLLSTTGS